MTTQYEVQTNEQHGSGKWVIFSDDGTTVGKHDDPDGIRLQLNDLGIDIENGTVLMDVDGNGTMRQVPICWIGDGEKLIGSERASLLV